MLNPDTYLNFITVYFFYDLITYRDHTMNRYMSRTLSCTVLQHIHRGKQTQLDSQMDENIKTKYNNHISYKICQGCFVRGFVVHYVKSHYAAHDN